MRYVHWVTEATDTYTDYLILVDFPCQQLLNECPCDTLYVQCMSFSKYANSAVDTQFKFPA